MLIAAGLFPLTGYCRTLAARDETPVNDIAKELVLSDFTGAEPYVLQGSGWRGFSDRVMGGVSDATFGKAIIGGKNSMRLSGRVTRESNGGFIQMAMYFGSGNAELDASAYAGIELRVHGNNENYNVHVRTADCGWYDDSYRYTFLAKDSWQTVRIPWGEFKPNSVKVPLNSGRINRISILGWMREFQADIALARIALYT
jgi:hypothetical protein